MPRLLRFVASAALLVSVATLLSRLVGFGRLLVFSPSVGAGAIGTAYQSANQVPNILYEVVAGGALAGAVVPLLAGPLSRADKGTASRIASALLTWSVSLTLPLAVLIVVFREQIAGIVLDHETEVAYGAGFLLMFAPQLVLYAIGGVLTGVLQAIRGSDEEEAASYRYQKTSLSTKHCQSTLPMIHTAKQKRCPPNVAITFALCWPTFTCPPMSHW